MKVLYFGEVVDLVGRSEENIELPEHTLKALTHYLTNHYQLDFSHLKIAINQKLVDATLDSVLTPTDEIAILSQFAGG